MACSPLVSSDHGILQAGILEWVAIPFSKGNLPDPGGQSWVVCNAGRFFTIWVTREVQNSALSGVRSTWHSDDSIRTEKSNECIWESLGPGVRLGSVRGRILTTAGRVNGTLEGESSWTWTVWVVWGWEQQWQGGREQSLDSLGKRVLCTDVWGAAANSDKLMIKDLPYHTVNMTNVVPREGFTLWRGG